MRQLQLAVRGSEEEVINLLHLCQKSGMLLRTVHARICGQMIQLKSSERFSHYWLNMVSLLLPGASQPKKLSRLVAELKRQALVKDLPAVIAAPSAFALPSFCLWTITRFWAESLLC